VTFFVHPDRGAETTVMSLRASVALLIATVLLAASCVSQDAADPEVPQPIATPEPAPPAPRWPPVPPLEPVPPPDPRVAELDLSGVLVVEGWDPAYLFPEGRGPWSTDFTPAELSEVLLRKRPVPPGAVHIDVDVEIELDPADCYGYFRWVSGVTVDVAGPAGRRIEAALLPGARGGSSQQAVDRDETVSEKDRIWCEEYFGGERAGFHFVDIGAEACGYPDGPALLCATVSGWGYELGARDFWNATTYVFDVATGERLRAEQVLVPYDLKAVSDLFDRIDAEVDIPHLTWTTADLRLDAGMLGVDVMPTIEGMRWRWSPHHPITGSIDVLVPWHVLDELRRSEDVGPS
jgi:hypothetical protein